MKYRITITTPEYTDEELNHLNLAQKKGTTP